MFDSITTDYIVMARQCQRGVRPNRKPWKITLLLPIAHILLLFSPTTHVSGLKILGVRGYSFNRRFRRPPQNFLPGETCGCLSGGRRDRRQYSGISLAGWAQLMTYLLELPSSLPLQKTISDLRRIFLGAISPWFRRRRMYGEMELPRQRAWGGIIGPFL